MAPCKGCEHLKRPIKELMFLNPSRTETALPCLLQHAGSRVFLDMFATRLDTGFLVNRDKKQQVPTWFQNTMDVRKQGAVVLDVLQYM